MTCLSVLKLKVPLVNVLVNKKKLDTTGLEPKDLIDEILSQKANVLDDDAELEKIAREVIDENPEMVAQFKSGKVTIIQALVGQVMRKTQGRANAAKVLSILEKLLSEI